MSERSVIFLKKRIAVILLILTLIYVTADYSFDASVSASGNIDNREYVLGGEIIGIKLYGKGLICIDFESVSGKNPAIEAGLRRGDVILSVNGKEILNTDDFSKTVATSSGELKIVYDRDGEISETAITPIKDESGISRVGMWVRDSIAGVGTVTFYDEKEGEVVTLGHSVSDSDTGRNFIVRKGYITDCDVLSVEQSKSGYPGEIVGKFKEDEKIYGYITKNTAGGLFANSSGLTSGEGLKVKAASSREVKDGEAFLYTELGGDGVKPYKVEIKKVYSRAKGDMIVTVKDNELLSLTGGIVQGMSGSPLVQNGKLIGAVTHVFVNDPTRGYGIFIENMLSKE